LDRLSLRDAAQRLDISEGAVRKRITRGRLRSDMGADGKRYVYVPASDTEGEYPGGVTGISAELVGELRDRIAYLERQVEEERDARRRADTLLARMMDRVPELEAPESREAAAHAPAGEEEGRGPGPSGGEPERASERPWWWRLLGG
jgi:hypothetical protein